MDDSQPSNETALSTTVRAIWAEVLKVTDVPDDVHFIDLGGDSIAATQCVTAIATELGIEVPIESLFAEEATCAHFIELLGQASANSPEQARK